MAEQGALGHDIDPRGTHGRYDIGVGDGRRDPDPEAREQLRVCDERRLKSGTAEPCGSRVPPGADEPDAVDLVSNGLQRGQQHSAHVSPAPPVMADVQYVELFRPGTPAHAVRVVAVEREGLGRAGRTGQPRLEDAVRQRLQAGDPPGPLVLVLVVAVITVDTDTRSVHAVGVQDDPTAAGHVGQDPRSAQAFQPLQSRLDHDHHMIEGPQVRRAGHVGVRRIGQAEEGEIVAQAGGRSDVVRHRLDAAGIRSPLQHEQDLHRLAFAASVIFPPPSRMARSSAKRRSKECCRARCSLVASTASQ
jgi:hypothetical protein